MSRIDLALAIAHPDVYMQTGDSAFSRALTVSEFRTLALASLGGALEFYDFVIFVFFTGVIGKLFSLRIFRIGCGNFRPLPSLPRVTWHALWVAS